MPARYLEILAVQLPFPFNVDDADRTMFSFNLQATSSPAPGTYTWAEDLVLLLSAASLATLATDTFIGPYASIPPGDGPYITVIDTGGSSPLETHASDKYLRTSAQIVVRGRPYPTALSRAFACWQALDGLRNVTPTPPPE